jgi:NADH-quinone oxidoreductase subunit N
MNLTDYIAAAPEMALLGLICVVMIADLFVEDEERAATFWLSMASLVVTAVVLYVTAGADRQIVFYGAYVADPLSHILKMATILFVGISFLYARDYLRANDLEKGEYYLLGLFGLLGMMVMMSANSLLTMYLGLETLALSMYALVAIDRHNVTAAESAMKYFVLGAIASGALLYGISWVYGVTGSLQFDQIALALSADPGLNNLPLWFGMAFLIVGIAFKFGAVPFHMWLPDVYEGARTPVTLYLASAPKLAAFALIFRILVDGLGGLHDTWGTMIMFVAVLSIIVGNFIAIAQTNIKRMLGYSTIGHVGFILLAIYTGTSDGYAAGLFYALTYVVAAAGAFGVIIIMSRRGYEAELISDFKGLNTRSPWFALMMLFLMFSMAGVPPFVGFLSKLYVISAVLDVGGTWLAILMEGEDRAVLQAGRDTRLVLSLNSVAVLALGIVPGWLLALCVSVLS